MKRSNLVKTLLSLTPLLLMGCSLQADDSQQPAPLPALVSDPSPESIAELQAAIASLLKIERVTIAGDAFTRSSRLSLERSPHKAPNGQLIMGRNFELPQTVQLWISAEICFVTDADNHRSAPLTHTQCKAE
ncbi:hypothetical protein [Shewanella woodyi]|uniref:hypothetical protein n=1 Tax=Shewanella woodyi TaxID=60961 RepID=UPI0007F97247|nr:hypothetical protein [Shewanella woodyi]